ncbi:PadR family transcriptional regulator [Amnibacterium flavum]|uniref:PadR family transcriptional regulator n=1 Tax=Amnibacterium flavum TaxID=2173173 RepID=A0A2V1HRV7_9MICO|nr:PadR family transcriptional regulator [Amnibacterium flavum]PVZ95288.1 PadR family transcriptional regulator [Amnibacterium flavum]
MSPAVFGRGHLRLYLLALLDERPRHGYELMQALTEQFGGTYVPSAGTIYPRLAKLEDDGLVTKQSDGRKTVYAITDAGRVELESRRDELEGIEGQVTDSVRHLADEVRRSVDDAMKTLRADLAASARDAREGARSSGQQARRDTDDARVTSRMRLQDADSAVSRFRNELRSDLRIAAEGGTLSQETTELISAGLDDLLGRIRGSLGR